MDSWVDKSTVISGNSEAGTSLTVQDLARHLGHASLSVNSVTINSVLPYQSSAGATNTWTPSGVAVFYINSSGTYDITSLASVTTQSSSTGVDGYVNVNIPDFTAVVGKTLDQNDDIRLDYQVSGSSHASTQTYSFCQTSILRTSSGTPMTRTACDDVVIPGVGGEEPGPGPSGGPGGGGPIAPAQYSEIIKEIGEGYFVADNLVRILAGYSIIDTGTNGVKDIRGAVYIPEHGALDRSSLEFRVFDNSDQSWAEWRRGIDYELVDNGITLVEDRVYREFLINKLDREDIFSSGLQLFDKDRIEISYLTTVPVGTSFILTRVHGYNYYQDEYMFEDLYIPVRREGTIQDPDVSEGEWEQQEALVGVPVRWLKTISAANPNNASIEQSLRFEVFPDTLSVSLVGSEGTGKEPLLLKEDGGAIVVDVLARMQAGETIELVLEAATPPVLEIGRVIDVLESSEREIRFRVNMTINNPSLEDYSDVSLIFRTASDKIVSVSEAGHLLNYTSHDSSSTEIFLGQMGSGWTRNLEIIYNEVPPILVVSTSSFIYGCEENANMTVFVIPSEHETGAYLELEVVGPDPELKTISARLMELKETWPWEEVRVPVGIDIHAYPDGKYFVYTRFKKDFHTILSDRSDFYVDCPERTIVAVSWTGFLIIAVILIGYIVLRSWRRRHGDFRILRRKLRDLG
jgi:hypothetical protein